MMQLVFTQIQMVSSFKTRIEFHHPDGFHQPNGISLQGSSAAPGASESSQALSAHSEMIRCCASTSSPKSNSAYGDTAMEAMTMEIDIR